MAEKKISVRQQQKIDTSANWSTNNPVLLAGEIGIESDTNKIKIGDGTNAWNDLNYIDSNIEQYLSLLNSTEYKAFAFYSTTTTSSFLMDVSISRIDYWTCSKFNTLSVGDKILCFVNAYKTNEERQTNALYSCTITALNQADYSVSSTLFTIGGLSPTNAYRDIALLSDLDSKVSKSGDTMTGPLSVPSTNFEWREIGVLAETSITIPASNQVIEVDVSNVFSQTGPLKFSCNINIDGEITTLEVEEDVTGIGNGVAIKIQQGVTRYRTVNVEILTLSSFSGSSLIVSGTILQRPNAISVQDALINGKLIVRDAAYYRNTTGNYYRLLNEADAAGYVTKSGEQTISGDKTYSGTTTFDGDVTGTGINNLINTAKSTLTALATIQGGSTRSYYALWKWQIPTTNGTPLYMIGGVTPASEGNKTIYFRMNNATGTDVFGTQCMFVTSVGIRTSDTSNGWQYASFSSKSSGTIVQVSSGSVWLAIGY